MKLNSYNEYNTFLKIIDFYIITLFIEQCTTLFTETIELYLDYEE